MRGGQTKCGVEHATELPASDTEAAEKVASVSYPMKPAGLPDSTQILAVGDVARFAMCELLPSQVSPATLLDSTISSQNLMRLHDGSVLLSLLRLLALICSLFALPWFHPGSPTGEALMHPLPE